jgi:DNA-binding XRE family transcriptional regulator
MFGGRSAPSGEAARPGRKDSRQLTKKPARTAAERKTGPKRRIGAKAGKG